MRSFTAVLFDLGIRENSLLKKVKNNYESLQLLIQEKDETNVECYSALINYEILLYDEKKKSQEVDSLHSTLSEHDVKIQQLLNNEKNLF
jgi:hypothetical protein